MPDLLHESYDPDFELDPRTCPGSGVVDRSYRVDGSDAVLCPSCGHVGVLPDLELKPSQDGRTLSPHRHVAAAPAHLIRHS